MNKLIFISALFLVISCAKNQEILTGDLWFKQVNLMSNEGFSPDRIIIIEKTLDIDKVTDKDLKKLYKSLILLRKQNLLNSPYIRIKIEKNDNRIVHLNKEQYNKIKKYTLNYLTNNKTKLQLELKVKELEKDLYYSDEILNLKEVQGQTYFEK